MGISFLDKVRTLENFKKISFHKIIYPTLFLPFLSRSSDIIGKKILLKFEKNIFSLNFNINISSNFQKKRYPLIAKKAKVFFLENKLHAYATYNHLVAKIQIVLVLFLSQPNNLVLER